MKRRDIIIGIIVLVVLGLGIYYLLQNDSGDQIEISPSPSPVSVEDVEERFNIDIPEDAETAELRGEGATALATREVVDGVTEISVLADLPDPDAGVSYQAWLVQGEEGSEDFNRLLLGRMNIAKGGFVIDYSTSDDLSGYSQVLVSREQTLDSTVESIVLEGAFSE